MGSNECIFSLRPIECPKRNIFSFEGILSILLIETIRAKKNIQKSKQQHNDKKRRLWGKKEV